MKVISVDAMRELDRRTIAAGTPGDVLMERAGEGLYRATMEWLQAIGEGHGHRVVIAAGKGNNGGDGHVLARLLAERSGLAVGLLSVCPVDELSGDARLNALRLPAGVELRIGESLPDDWLEPGTVLVDALLGTGIKGEVREPFASLIRQLNDSGLPILAVDIPSGLDGDSGAVANVAIRADLTVTMALPKSGLLRGEGPERAGRLRVVDIGVPAAFVADTEATGEAFGQADAARHLGRLPAGAHKGTMGRVLIVGGSLNYPGAPMLVGRAALRSGAGLVTVAYPRAMAPLARPQLNALILNPLEDDGRGCHHDYDASGLADLLDKQDVLAVGPGIGRDPDTLEMVGRCLEIDRPLVLDADGLNVFATLDHLPPRRAPLVITPHPGEMARIIEALGLDLAEAAREDQARGVAAQLGCIVVLKGHRTVVAGPDERCTVNLSGSPALASGGSGDVLTGAIAAGLCQVEDPHEAAALAVFLHGLAGELAPRGMRSLVADDLPELLGAAMQALSPFA